ncbi:GNAT family N-acetyltransferase [Parasalinivibrio latis]|uniref:GNAT family N-acetyltransferase n=1 Tax=Parasalinivibrio latis TaxID=2952610 RepID=UPI0030DF90C8
MSLECRVVPSIEEFGEAAWNTLLPDDFPFLRFEFFEALEQSNVLGAKRGWLPQYIGVYRNDVLVGAAPCFLKGHSYGEYVFDWAWAEAYEDAGLEYYPKIVCAIPFTPATGPRFLVVENDDKEEIERYLLGGLLSLTEQLECSGAHILFHPKSNSASCAKAGFLERCDVQFHWYNRGYEHFDDFLAALTSRKRKNIRKERNSVIAQGITVEVVEGQDITDQHLSRFFQFYRRTYLKRSGHSGYLNQAFFNQLGRLMNETLVLVFARAGEEYVAGSLYLRSSETLYGRYWGCLSEFENLHFELCYYQGIEYCIRHGLSKFDAGAQGEHKLLRGFEPVLTYSAHFLRHNGFQDAIADYLRRESKLVSQYVEDAMAHLPFKQT